MQLGVLIYNLGKVPIGSRVTLSLRARLCAGAHAHTRSDMSLVRTPIRIGAAARLCAELFVGPRVNIAVGAVVGARAFGGRGVPLRLVLAGNPAGVAAAPGRGEPE